MTDEIDMTDKELDIKKRKFRRNAAIISFVYILVICTFYISVGLLIDHETAKTMAEFNSIIIMQLGVLSSVVLGHLGFDYFEKTR